MDGLGVLAEGGNPTNRLVADGYPERRWSAINVA